MATTNIDWAEKVWNPTIGCSKVSAGCRDCYAEPMHKRLQAMGQKKYIGHPFLGGAIPHYDSLDIPKHWKKPQRIFVNSMSDLFHEAVSFLFIDKVFDVIAECPQHDFIILTKRAGNMNLYFSTREHHREFGNNIIVGVSIENDQFITRADTLLSIKSRYPQIRTVISFEPLLSTINMKPILTYSNGEVLLPNNMIDWIIIGGESGHKARPMCAHWAGSIISQVKGWSDAKIFFKQWGKYVPVQEIDEVEEYDKKAVRNIQVSQGIGEFLFVKARGSKHKFHKIDEKIYREYPERVK